MVGKRQEVLLRWKGVGKWEVRGKSTPAWVWCARVFKFGLKLCIDLMQALTPGVSFT